MATPSRSDLAPRLRVPGYLVLGLICLQPLVDLLSAAWPPRLGVATWRFSFLGTASNSLLLPLVGLFLIYALATLLGDRTIALTIGMLTAVLGLVCLAAMGAFALDALQLRAQVRPEAAARFNIGSAWAFGKLGLGFIASIALSMAGFGTSSALSREASSRSATRPSSLVVGQAIATPIKPVAGGPQSAVAPPENG